MLDAEDRGELRERRLRRAVAAPARYASTAASEVMLTIRALVAASRGSASWTSAERREDVDLVDPPKLVERVLGRAPAAGSAPSTLALLTSRSIGSPAASTSRRRCSGSATSPATATTPSRPATARSSAAPSRASTTSRQPRSRQRPREREPEPARCAGDDARASCGLRRHAVAGRRRGRSSAAAARSRPGRRPRSRSCARRSRACRGRPGGSRSASAANRSAQTCFGKPKWAT